MKTLFVSYTFSATSHGEFKTGFGDLTAECPAICLPAVLNLLRDTIVAELQKKNMEVVSVTILFWRRLEESDG